MQLTIEMSGEAGADGALAASTVHAIIAGALQALNISDDHVDVGVQWVDEAVSQTLNREHRGVDRATDVLSFPIDGRDPLAPQLARQLGDLAICIPVVERQLADGSSMWPAADTTLAQALARCVAHGVLHLLGFEHDDEDDAAAMFELEAQILRAVAA